MEKGALRRGGPGPAVVQRREEGAGRGIGTAPDTKKGRRKTGGLKGALPEKPARKRYFTV